MNRVIVYNIETGEIAMVDGVDAKEYVQSGGWTYSKPEQKVKDDDFKKTKRAKIEDK
jgi:hypothetical protein